MIGGVAVAALTVYDMCEAIDKVMVIGEIRLVRNTGGVSRKFRGGCGNADRNIYP
jgi:cyclic pyranopterin phosphate synthase